MTDNINECREKFRKLLSIVTPQQIVSDDTFLEKIQSYLTFSGKLGFLISLLIAFHNNLLNFLPCSQNTMNSSKILKQLRGLSEPSNHSIPTSNQHNRLPISP